MEQKVEQKADWAQMDEDDDDNQRSDNEEQGEQQERPQREAGQSGQTGTTRPPGTRGTGRGRGRGRGDGRGRGRGDGRGGRGDYRGDHRGGQRDKEGGFNKPKESQPKHEMKNLINRQQSSEVVINLFNVDYNASEEDVRKLYHDVNINNVDRPKAGHFLIELKQAEALKLVEIGNRSLNGREVFMRLSNYGKQLRDDQWHTVAKSKNDVVNTQWDNRREHGEKKPYHKREPREEKPVEFDPDNKFFKGHDLNAGEFKIKFTKSSSKANEEGQAPSGETAAPKVSKPNPFGDAKPRDESEFVKKFEEKKEEKPETQEAAPQKEGELVKPPPGISAKAAEGEQKKAQQQGGKGGRFFNSSKPATQQAPLKDNKAKEDPKEKGAKKETAKGNVFNMLGGEDDEEEEEEDDS